MEPLALRRFIQGSEKNILFCGDDDIDMAAIYLAAIIHAEGYDMDYVPSALPFPQSITISAYDLIILSDYPREQINDERLKEIADFTKQGGSLLMIGGWESFTGLNIEYKNSPLEDVLPVKLNEYDDRRNYDQGIAVTPLDIHHPICKDLDWMRPAVIGGYNEFEPKDKNACILCGRKIEISAMNGILSTEVNKEEIPLLVMDQIGEGKTAALAFDLAPHWVGGFVDWGTDRKHIDFETGFIEVGNMYYKFVANLLKSMF
ncbi:MAG: glutamine amidotransferase [Candidatus Marinimicrobia bacterium]|nr:glutamine amidotransferase [Candidatus Neomarinimicrobiota bacterium]